MKLLSLNVEGSKHLERTSVLFKEQMADVVCLQECNEETISVLKSLGYATHFLPMTLRSGEKNTEEGVVLASLHPVTFSTHYYHTPNQTLSVFAKEDSRNTNRQGLIVGTVSVNEVAHTIATTHFTWTEDGSTPNQSQVDDIEALLQYTQTLGSHVICGDFNIPRSHSSLYKEITDAYTDQVPQHHKSSMDAQLHRLGSTPGKEIIFTNYMVDYILTKGPYGAQNVELIFGVSDHAAVIGNITLD
ncbi:MAG: exonuclease III [Patiriisocius sp.]|jgi:exonuclease III